MISLDFELHWGVRVSRSVASYRANLLGVREVVPTLLRLFREYGIAATWATVGMLSFDSKRELVAAAPGLTPRYRDPRVSSYAELDAVGENERDDPYHYAPSLIRAIRAEERHELGSHTFSHYYCLEPGADVASFADDLAAARNAARRYDATLRSLVFPGNQIAPAFLDTAEQRGFGVFRGTESAWLYRPRARGEQTTIRRGLRLLDAYFLISSHNAYSPDELVTGGVVNVPSSRFLRPYVPSLARLEGLRARRIESDLDYAACKNLVYHLWWHPHNFGVSLRQNVVTLRRVLDRFARLRERYGLRSVTMGELADEVRSDR